MLYSQTSLIDIPSTEYTNSHTPPNATTTHNMELDSSTGSASNAETRESPRKDWDEYDLIIGRRGSKGYCSHKVREFLQGWYMPYANTTTKHKSSLLQQQVYPDFCRHNFKAYRKDSQGVLCLETDQATIIAKLKKEMEAMIKVKDNENIDASQKRKGGDDDDDGASGNKPPKKKGRARRPVPSNRQEEVVVTLDGEDLLLEAYMDEIPFKSAGLGDSTSSPSAFRAPEFHFLESGPVSVSATQHHSNHDYVKDVFQWQEFESYAMPPNLGHESGSPTTSTILRSIASGVYVSPETIPEGEPNETGAFSSTSINNHTKPSVSRADQTTTLDQQYNTPSGLETNSQIPFSDSPGGDQKHSKTVSAGSNTVFDTSSLVPPASHGVASDASKTQGAALAPASMLAKPETSKKKTTKTSPKAVPCFKGPSPISFHVLNPSRPTPPLAPKPPPSLVDMMMGAFKHFEQRAEALERENMAVWTRLHELEMRYDTLLSSSNKQNSETKSDDETPAIFEV